MVTKSPKGKITGLLALTVESQVDTNVGDWVHLSGDYEVELADGSKPVLGRVSVSNKRRISSPMGTSVGNPNVPGPVTVEARGLMVVTDAAGGAFAAGEEVGIGAAGLVAAGDGVASVGIALTASTGAGDEVDVLVS